MSGSLPTSNPMSPPAAVSAARAHAAAVSGVSVTRLRSSRPQRHVVAGDQGPALTGRPGQRERPARHLPRLRRPDQWSAESPPIRRTRGPLPGTCTSDSTRSNTGMSRSNRGNAQYSVESPSRRGDAVSSRRRSDRQHRAREPDGLDTHRPGMGCDRRRVGVIGPRVARGRTVIPSWSGSASAVADASSAAGRAPMRAARRCVATRSRSASGLPPVGIDLHGLLGLSAEHKRSIRPFRRPGGTLNGPARPS